VKRKELLFLKIYIYKKAHSAEKRASPAKLILQLAFRNLQPYWGVLEKLHASRWRSYDRRRQRKRKRGSGDLFDDNGCTNVRHRNCLGAMECIERRWARLIICSQEEEKEVESQLYLMGCPLLSKTVIKPDSS